MRAGRRRLAERGFGKGDVFAHYAPNLPEYAVAFHAVAGRWGEHDREPAADRGGARGAAHDSGARLLVTVPELLEKATAAAARAGVEEIFVYGEADGATPFASLLRRMASRPRSRSTPPRISSRCPIRAAPPGCRRE